MNYIEREKFRHIESVFELNFSLTRLYADYLNHYPECLCNIDIDALAAECGISREAAILAALEELFGIDYERSAEDRRMIRDYLTPSVRLMDAEKYRQNPYYRNITIPDVTEAGWELRNESYKPYRGVIAGDVMMYEDFREVAPLGFFTEEFVFPAVLEGGNEWMTLTPVDLDTCEEAIAAAHGRVVTFGLGLGYYAYMVSKKEEVESITVVERSAEVIRLFKNHILPQFPHGEKVKIVEADAFVYAERVMPAEEFDYAFVDTWRDASDGAPMYERMKRLEHLSPKTKFSYWIENFLISRHRALKFAKIREWIESGDPRAPKTCAEAVETLKNPLGL